MKTILALMLLSFSAFSYEIPKELLALIPASQDEIILKGSDGVHDCHLRVQNKHWGFNIDLYYPNSQGEMNLQENAHFAIDPSYELYDYWKYLNGIEAVAMHFSPMGSSYDIRSTLYLEYKNNKLFSVELDQEKKGLFGGFTTDQRIYCQLTNL